MFRPVSEVVRIGRDILAELVNGFGVGEEKYLARVVSVSLYVCLSRKMDARQEICWMDSTYRSVGCFEAVKPRFRICPFVFTNDRLQHVSAPQGSL